MKIKITNKKILDILETKNKFVVANQNLLKEMEKLEKEFNTNMGKTARCDEKVRPLIRKEVMKLNIEEFEELSRVTNESGVWEMETVDRLDEFKKNFKKVRETKK